MVFLKYSLTACYLCATIICVLYICVPVVYFNIVLVTDKVLLLLVTWWRDNFFFKFAARDHNKRQPLLLCPFHPWQLLLYNYKLPYPSWSCCSAAINYHINVDHASGQLLIKYRLPHWCWWWCSTLLSDPFSNLGWWWQLAWLPTWTVNLPLYHPQISVSFHFGHAAVHFLYIICIVWIMWRCICLELHLL